MSEAVHGAASAAAQPQRELIYTRYERFWHWSQAILIFILLATGFVIHGTTPYIRFGTAVSWHTWTAIALIVLWVFTVFWHLTTGEWRQYAPRSGVVDMMKYYGWGILTGQPHPFHKTMKRKHNPLQAAAYLGFVLFIGPLLWASGVAYLTFPLWAKSYAAVVPLGAVALVHTAGAFMMAIFIIVHVYMATTGKTASAYIRSMISGYEEV